MGDEQVLNDLIAVTQQTLQPLISKPKLTEKLLGKPPFRFLHDVFSNLIKGSGFAEGLYSAEEMDSANIQDKQQKLDYLEKIITCVGICLGAPVDVRPGKIVAGLEPENTNIFLQALARAASDASIDSAAAVRRTLGGEKAGDGPAAKKGSTRPAAAAEKEADPEEEKISVRRESMDSRRGSFSTLDAKGGPAPVTRGSSSKAVTAPLAGPTAPPKQLDSQIDACNSDMTRTKDVIEALISRPKPNEKLLSKPPFRFLHDIVSEVVRTTGFGKGLYDETESDSSKVTEKGAKIAYLEKVIKLVGMHLNTIVEARPSKIVAGLEPENTNRFLQLLILAATELPDTTETVRLLLDPDAAPSLGGGAGERPSTRGPAAMQPAAREAIDEDEPPMAAAIQQQQQQGPSRQQQQVAAPREPEIKRAAAKGGDDDKDEPVAPPGPFKTPTGLAATTAALGSKEEGPDGGEGEGQSAAGAPVGSEEKRSMRPRTARQRPPKVKDNVKEVDVKDAAKAAPKSTVVIMREGNDGDKSDEETAEDEGFKPTGPASRGPDGSGKAQHGKLVQDIMQEQKKEDEARKREAADEEKKDAGDGGIRLGRLKKGGQESKSGGKAAVVFGENEIEALRTSIQVMCQSTNPLGKCMDYVHEDLAVMNKEYDRWQAEYRGKLDALEEQKRVTEEDVQSLRLQLLELDEQVKEQNQKINSVKCSISKNDERIEQLLRLVVTVHVAGGGAGGKK